MSDFEFIFNVNEYKVIFDKCILAEKQSIDERKAILSREALEECIRFIYNKECKKFPESATLFELINGSVINSFVNNSTILRALHFTRIVGMKAIHDNKLKKKEIKTAYDNVVFFVRFIYKKYEEPEKIIDIVLPKYMGEAETRKIYIDLYLQEAGWEVVEPNDETILPDGTKIKSGNIIPTKACCEIPVKGMKNKSGIGFCDYVLYGRDGKPLAIVEAKRTSEEAIKGSKQVKDYGECMKSVYGYIPVLYYTNGYEIFVIDGKYPARRIMGFHSIQDLEYMISKRDNNQIVDTKVNEDIAGRPYQQMAITNICERFNEMHRRSLIVMATGTGKTRVSIALVDVLLRNKWIKRVLFLADRTSLVEQAFRNFSKILDKQSYCVLSSLALASDKEARITFSTYQTMIGYIDAEEKEYSCGRYDLIIIDEAHRSIFNKYGAIFEYFDALIVGLTATPKDEVDASTYDMFNCESGEPNYSYSLDEAVAEKYLVPYKVITKTTKLLSQGVKYSDLSEDDKKSVDSVLLDDVDVDYIIPKEKLFKLFYNVDTCAKVIEDLMTNGLKVDYGQNIGKTIIFAYNHRHAELIVKTFKKYYPSYGEDYCQLIDNKVKGADGLIEKFGTDSNFRIAVSVDMLDTGIDVPSVLNLVFFKPIKSKIKFVQMIGRGTRLCEKLIDGQDKKYFLIFDYCDNFEYFDMNPNGASVYNGKSLSQKLYDIKLDILVELQSYEHQSDALAKAYYDKLKAELYRKTCDIKEYNSKRIAVRQEMNYVDKYVDYEEWEAIAPLEKKEIQLHLSKLIDNDIDEDKSALRFDMQMLQIELSVIASGGIVKAAKSVEKVRSTAKKLLSEVASMQAVKEKADTLLEIVSKEAWDSPTIDRLEKYREDVRDLISYIPAGPNPVDIDTPDEAMDGEYTVDGLIDIRTYREKILDYLVEHVDNETIHKIQKLEPINANDVKELERILWHELGTEEDYHKETNISNLAVFIRSIVGIEQEVINEKFGQFLNDNVLNSQQQEFIRAIINYVRENGDIIEQDLLDKKPFDRYDILSLFGTNVTVIKKIVGEIHNSIMAA